MLADHLPLTRSPSDILARLEALLVDLDGVVYRGNVPLPGAQALVPTLLRLGIRYAFVTNNATLTPRQFAVKLSAMGVKAKASDIVTSAEAAARYLQNVAPPNTTVSLIGEAGLRQAIRRAGFGIDDEHPSFVVVGLDRRLTYRRLAAACVAIRNGAQLIAANADPAYPVEDGWWPGTGAILAALTAATGVEPILIGKPSPTLLRVALERTGGRAESTAMVGDQVRTDVRAGQAAGLVTILIPSGGEPFPDEPKPDLVFSDLAELIRNLETR